MVIKERRANPVKMEHKERRANPVKRVLKAIRERRGPRVPPLSMV